MHHKLKIEIYNEYILVNKTKLIKKVAILGLAVYFNEKLVMFNSYILASEIACYILLIYVLYNIICIMLFGVVSDKVVKKKIIIYEIIDI